MSALFGYFDPAGEGGSPFDHKAVVEAMSRELVFDSAAGRAEWEDGGLRFVQLYHEVSADRCTPVRDAEGGLTLYLDGEIYGRPPYGKREYDLCLQGDMLWL